MNEVAVLHWLQKHRQLLIATLSVLDKPYKITYWDSYTQQIDTLEYIFYYNFIF